MSTESKINLKNNIKANDRLIYYFPEFILFYDDLIFLLLRNFYHKRILKNFKNIKASQELENFYISLQFRNNKFQNTVLIFVYKSHKY